MTINLSRVDYFAYLYCNIVSNDKEFRKYGSVIVKVFISRSVTNRCFMCNEYNYGGISAWQLFSLSVCPLAKPVSPK